jgi:hypothetical protein
MLENGMMEGKSLIVRVVDTTLDAVEELLARIDPYVKEFKGSSMSATGGVAVLRLAHMWQMPEIVQKYRLNLLGTQDVATLELCLATDELLSLGMRKDIICDAATKKLLNTVALIEEYSGHCTNLTAMRHAVLCLEKYNLSSSHRIRSRMSKTAPVVTHGKSDDTVATYAWVLMSAQILHYDPSWVGSCMTLLASRAAMCENASDTDVVVRAASKRQNYDVVTAICGARPVPGEDESRKRRRLDMFKATDTSGGKGVLVVRDANPVPVSGGPVELEPETSM